ncbi:MAG: hypothetical protein GEU88_16285 [Solirubrobacterales bacterium]|nr:hypothetical protein [Solirubrobacterales bacterium]
MRRFTTVSALLTTSALLLAFVGLPAIAMGQGSGVDQYTENVPGAGGSGNGGGTGGGYPY